MIKISKEEADIIRKEFKDAHIVSTCKRKGAAQRTYYMTEETKLMDRIKKLRGE